MRPVLTAAKLSLATLRHMRAGLNYANGLPTDATGPALAAEDGPNPLEAYFDTVTEGPGIWKWRHYFQIYHRHLSKFVGRSPHVLEIGVYSGGSLPMWLDYFGVGTQVYGVDIEPACKAHERDGVHQQIASVHRYPMVAVIEKPDRPLKQFVSEKHGTVWQPGTYSESYD